MRRSSILPVLAALVLTGGASGLYLGHSAVGEIDPVYMMADDEGARFYSDMVPGGARLNDAPPKLRNASLEQGLGSGCPGCITYPREYVPDHDPSVDGYIGAYAAYAPPPSAEEIVNEVDAMIAEVSRAHFEQVERYAYYRVGAEGEPEREAEPVQLAVREVAMDASAEADCVVEDQCAGQPTPGI